MEITSSDVQFTSQHSANQSSASQESLKVWVGNQRPDFEGTQSQANPPAAIVSLSAQGLAASSADNGQYSPRNDPKYSVIIRIVEALTGQKINFGTPSAVQQAPVRAGFGVEYDRHQSSTESEQTSFAAHGTVKTADGKEVAFSVSLSMARSYTTQSDTSLRLGDAKTKDPLVVNFGGTAAELTDQKYSFDLNSNGQKVSISFAGPNSGFLAIDKNGNGKIDNGSELFGPTTGNGFQELAAYDQNKNGWIDSHDPIFQQLRIWQKDASGNDIVSTLAQKNISAIYVGNTSTPFDLKNSQNQLQGQVRSSGIYLNDQGGAGTVQQVDLAV